MVRIFVYSNRLIRKHELVFNSVSKLSIVVFKSRVSFRVVDILRLLDKEDLLFTLGDNSKDNNSKDDYAELNLYLVLDTDDNKLIESFSTILNLVLSFA